MGEGDLSGLRGTRKAYLRTITNTESKNIRLNKRLRSTQQKFGDKIDCF